MTENAANNLISPHTTLLPSLPEECTVFVHGSETRLGLAFLRLLLSCSNVTRVWAAHVDFVPNVELHALALENPDRLGLVVMDPQREPSVQWAADTVARSSECIDLLINCVDERSQEPSGVTFHGSRQPDLRFAIELLERLSLTPLLIAKHFGSLLPRSGRGVFVSVTTHGRSLLGAGSLSEAEQMVFDCQQAVTKFLSHDLGVNNGALVCTTLEAHMDAISDMAQVDETARASARALLASIDRLSPDSGECLEAMLVHTDEPRRRA